MDPQTVRRALFRLSPPIECHSTGKKKKKKNKNKKNKKKEEK